MQFTFLLEQVVNGVVVAGLFAVIASASLMHTLHLSVALGAFIAGVVLAESPYRHELESDVEPFRSILLGMFFLSVGMLLDLNAIAADPLFIAGAAASLVGTLPRFSLAQQLPYDPRPAGWRKDARPSVSLSVPNRLSGRNARG